MVRCCVVVRVRRECMEGVYGGREGGADGDEVVVGGLS